MRADQAAWLLVFGVMLCACGAAPERLADRSSLVPRRLPGGDAAASAKPAQAVGAGQIVAGSDKASFDFSVLDAAPAGEIVIDGVVGDAAFRLQGTISEVAIRDDLVVLSGSGKLNDTFAFFSVRAQDSAPDSLSFAITMDSWNITLAGALARGDIAISPGR